LSATAELLISKPCIKSGTGVRFSDVVTGDNVFAVSSLGAVLHCHAPCDNNSFINVAYFFFRFLIKSNQIKSNLLMQKGQMATNNAKIKII